jgi:hypothetical protein
MEAVTEMLIRDRIRELRRVRARDLLANPKNWRVHPKAQSAALRGLLSEIGYADAHEVSVAKSLAAKITALYNSRYVRKPL